MDYICYTEISASIADYVLLQLSMPEHSLEELRKLATPALRHAELVTLARTKRPNEARTIAHDAGWPRRQVRAVKFLATLVRDYGSGALDALITSMEQVRAATSAAQEQAREKAKMSDRIRDRLKLITDPAKRLEIMAKNEMWEDATAYIHELVETHPVYFWWHDDRERELFHVPTGKADPIGGVRIGVHPSNTNLAQDRLNLTQNSIVALNLRGAITTLQWSDEQVLQYVRKVFEKMLQFPFHTRYFYWVIAGMERVCRHFLPVSDELAVQVERRTLLYHFRGGRLFELRSRALPSPVGPNNDGTEAELNPIVDRFLALGYTPEQVRDEFLKWIKDHASNCRPEVMLAAAGAKCFRHDDDDRYQNLRSYLPEVWEHILRQNDTGAWFNTFAKLAGVGLFRASGTRYIPAPERTPHPVAAVKGPREPQPTREPYVGDEEFFRTELVKLMSKGEAAKVYQLLNLLGHRMGLLRDGKGNINNASAFMASIAPAAFKLAHDEGRFGIAAALFQHFNCVDEKAIRDQVNEEFREEAATILGDYVRDDDAEYLNSDISEQPTDENGDPDADKEQKMLPIRTRRNEKLDQVLAASRRQVRESVQIALDLDQPIKLEFMSYYWLPNRSTN